KEAEGEASPAFDRKSSRLRQSQGSKSGDRSAAQRNTKHDSRENVAEEMHTQDDAGDGDVQRKEHEHAFQRRIKVTDDQRDGNGGHRVPRRKRKLIGRQHLRPAMRLNLAWAGTLADVLQRLE